MFARNWKRMFALGAGALLFGCSPSAVDDPDLASTTAEATVVGGHLAGIGDADFSAAQANFNQVETINDGVGPIFNDVACGRCHSLGAIGGAGQQIERRFGKFVNGVFNSLASEGGSLRQLQSVGSFTGASGQACNVPVEHEPTDATVHNVGRLTTSLFGLGLVDAMPDSFFTNLVAAEPATVRGTVNTAAIALPNPADASQSIGKVRVARFGWKADTANLADFAAGAYLNEMGITTQHCFKGTSITAFTAESRPNGVAVPAGCDDLAPPAPAGVPAGTDDAVGPCAAGQTEIQDDVQNFLTFMTFLAPAPRDLSDLISINAGAPVFNQIGCNGCHVTTTFTTPNPAPNGVPGGFAFNPFSDFAVHDMGTLGDQIGKDGDSVARTRQMRTAPLWGIRFRNNLLHDGRTTDIPTAIAAHDGQGKAAATAFAALSATDQHNVVQFIRSL
ncbi:MAG TPA: di-heme oxidoredictase family protein [Kofleriaceae bacterium]